MVDQSSKLGGLEAGEGAGVFVEDFAPGVFGGDVVELVEGDGFEAERGEGAVYIALAAVDGVVMRRLAGRLWVRRSRMCRPMRNSLPA